jgi:hypothetical protein
VLIGLWHERALQGTTGRFFVAYEAVGLVYLNLSLLILSIDVGVEHGAFVRPYGWVVVMTLTAIAQIVVGARLQSALLVGFGVTFTYINGFTRFYESFWDTASKGMFFLLGGVLTLVAGFLCELALARRGRGRLT